MKKTITFFPTQAAKMLLATLLLTLTAQTARAAEYEISTLQELREFMEAVHVEDFAGDDIRLTADIDCEGGRFNTGDPEYPSTFRGTFDGQGHKIYNFVHGPSGYGEYGYGTAMFDFAETGANIKNLTLEGTLPGTYSGAYSAAFVMAVKSPLGLWLDNCHFNGSVTNVYHSAALVGFASSGTDNMEVPSVTLNNCSANANITTTSNNIAGGLVAKGTGVVASDCSFNGKVTSLGTVGGLIGEAINCTLENCQVGSDFTLSDGATTIGKNAFNGCSGLTSIVIPASVETIDYGAFQGCSGLTSIEIPAGVTSIGMYAFANCPNLGTITMNSSPLIGGDAFNNIKIGAAVTINAPANEADSYKWATFYNKNYAFQADDDTQVFKVTLSGTKITLLEVADKIVDAGTPVVLKSSGEKPIMTWTTSSSSDEQGNDLKGTSEAITTPDNIYVLNYSTEHGVGFYKLATTGTLGVGKAYLEYDGASPSNFFGFEEGETTSIELKSSRIEELKYYDLNGRRVLNPTKGIYIVNGKKIIR